MTTRSRRSLALAGFEPLVAEWFEDRFGAPTSAQFEGWDRIASGADTLIAAPTGSGKTLAAFLWSVSALVAAGRGGTLADETSVVYVSPLKALGNDVQKNLLQPLAEIRSLADAAGTALPEIRVSVRSGDTPERERRAMSMRPPHILITTPESLCILLTTDRGRRGLRTARVVIVDEIHAVAGDKRGAHLALSLERLDALAGRRLQRIGLSATQKPIKEIAGLLSGAAAAPAIVDVGHRRPWALAIETLDNPLGAVATHEHWAEVYDRLAARIAAHRATLVFVHTRSLAERITHQLTQRLGSERVATHHGSLSRGTRLDAEQKLKSGALAAVVATASLELGIDIGSVDLVCHVGAPRAIASLLQRVGRAGHGVGGVSKGILFPLTRDDLVQAAAAVRAIRSGALDRALIPQAPVDVLAQQIVAEAAARPIAEDELWAMARRAYPYRNLGREEFEALLTVLADGVVPSMRTVVAERFFDEAGGMQLVLHAPFGGRVNRAWGLALRKRFCLTFDFELQAAATDDGILLSLGEQHSFPLETAFAFVREATLKEDLTQAILQSPIFETRWRQNASRALAVLRHSGGRRVPANLQRMRAADLLAAVFPEQVGCQDNHSGPVEPPDHPYVNETLRDCLHEAMDLDGLRAVLGDLRAKRIRAIAVDTPTPSPMSHEIVNAQPYAFLDDAPLEERRARAVRMRRTDPDLARGAGALDPAAIEEVRAAARPDLRDADETHDHLLTVGVLPEPEALPWRAFVDELSRAGRVAAAAWTAPDGFPRRAFYAVERADWVRRAIPGAAVAGDAPSGAPAPESEEDAMRWIVGGWMQFAGPITSGAIAARLGWTQSRIDTALAALERAGVVLRGAFTGEGGEEWCDRRLLARIHRLTLGRLRREIEPVSAADFVRFLFRWQGVLPGQQRHGRDGLAETIGQLQGFELPAPAWEETVFPARVAGYDPTDLDTLCLAGSVAWGRMRASEPEDNDGVDRATGRRSGTIGRNAPIAFLLRDDAHALLAPLGDREAAVRELSARARDVLDLLERRGAAFVSDIARALTLLPAQVEDALWELVARGLATGDGVAGLRHLLSPAHRRVARIRGLHAVGRRPSRALPVGRWSAWRPQGAVAGATAREEAWAAQLARRYGVVFRDVLARERNAPQWRSLAEIYRRAEARGDIRGGRFVAGFVGEQFALPAAVESLRAVRRTEDGPRAVLVHAADPLNLVGILVPGARVSPASGATIAFVGGAPVDVGPLGAVLGRLRALSPGV